MCEVKNRNTITTCEIYTKLTIKTSERRHSGRSVSLLLTSSIFHTLLWCFYFYIIFYLPTPSSLRPKNLPIVWPISCMAVPLSWHPRPSEMSFDHQRRYPTGLEHLKSNKFIQWTYYNSNVDICTLKNCPEQF